MEAGNQAEKIFIRDKNINGCIGCGACQKNGGQYISCFRGEGNAEGGYVIGYGTNMPGDVKDSPAISQAYKMGRNI